jgi:hypothetical protein
MRNGIGSGHSYHSRRRKAASLTWPCVRQPRSATSHAPDAVGGCAQGLSTPADSLLGVSSLDEPFTVRDRGSRPSGKMRNPLPPKPRSSPGFGDGSPFCHQNEMRPRSGSRTQKIGNSFSALSVEHCPFVSLRHIRGDVIIEAGVLTGELRNERKAVFRIFKIL